MKRLACILVVALVACDAETKKKSSGGGGGDSEVGDVYTETLGASGGSIATDSSAATATFGEDALADDVELTLEVLARSEQPNADEIESEAYELGPIETDLNGSFELRIRPSSAVPAHTRAFIVRLVGAAWVEIDLSMQMGDVVVGWPAQLGTYAVGFDQTFIPVPPDTFCDTFEFGACDSDPQGTWTMSHVCLTGAEAPDVADLPGCEDYEYGVGLRFDGTLDLVSGGTYTADFVSQTGITQRYGVGCLTAVLADEGAAPSVTPQMFCAGLSKQQAEGGNQGLCKWTTTCDCEMVEPEDQQDLETGTWSTLDEVLTMVEDGPGGTTNESPYCASSSQLQMELKSGAQTLGYFVFVK